ncbi:MAG: sulfatase-like hydrolase/transferase, partial [Gemmataceae bacterium]
MMVLLSMLLGGIASANAPLSKPNFVVILADDMGWGDLGAYNAASRIPTPRMDQMARESRRFLDAHSPSGVCTPTRYGLLTGRYSWRGKLKSGVLQGYSPALIEPGRPTLASHLKANGYSTCCVGKWHLGLQDGEKTDFAQPLTPGPLDVGFDRYFGISASLDMPPYVFLENRGLKTPLTGTIGAS